MMLIRFVALTMRIFLATVAVNILSPNGSLWERSIASIALAVMAGIKE